MKEELSSMYLKSGGGLHAFISIRFCSFFFSFPNREKRTDVKLLDSGAVEIQLLHIGFKYVLLQGSTANGSPMFINVCW